MGTVRVTKSPPTIRLTKTQALRVDAAGPFLRLTAPGGQTLRLQKAPQLRIDSGQDILRLTRGGALRFTQSVTTQARFPPALEIENPTASERIPWFRTFAPTTIVNINAVLRGSGGQSISFSVRFDVSNSAVGTELLTGGRTVTSITLGTDFVPDVTLIPAGRYVWLETTAQLGTVTDLLVTMDISPP